MQIPEIPQDSRGRGNTKLSPPKKKSHAIKWCFTFNGYKDSDIPIFIGLLKKNCKKFIFQKEVGKSGNAHLQGGLWFFKKGLPMTKFKEFPGIHWENMRDEEATIKYCQKTDTAVGEPILYGFPEPIDIITELRPWQKHILDNIVLTIPDKRTIYWYWDKDGNTGKSEFTKYLVVKHNAYFMFGGNKSDIAYMCSNINWDKCKCIIFDIPRASFGKVSYSSLEAIKNGMICSPKYESKSIVFNRPHVIVFANKPPEESELKLLSADRWNIVNISDLSNELNNGSATVLRPVASLSATHTESTAKVLKMRSKSPTGEIESIELSFY